MNLCKYLFPLAVSVVLFSTPLLSPAFGADAPRDNEPQSPIQIEADQMINNQKDSSVFFSGKVSAEQGDIIIHADEMTVYYFSRNDAVNNKEQAGGKSSRNIQRIRAVGNVEITKGEWVATGDTAEYFENEKKVVLVGDTRVWQNNNLITGDKFIMYLDEGKSVVERSSEKDERVKAFFYPNSENK